MFPANVKGFEFEKPENSNLYFSTYHLKPTKKYQLKLKLDSKDFFDYDVICIDKKIAVGGECVVFNLSNVENKVVKIYKKYNKKRKENFESINSEYCEKFLYSFSYNNIENIFVFEKLLCNFTEYDFTGLEEYKKVLKDVLKALRYIHLELNLLHNDINESNIMYDIDKKTVKLTDFSEAVHENKFSTYKLYCTMPLTHINLFMDRKNWGYEIDIWQFGLLTFYLNFKEDMFDLDNIEGSNITDDIFYEYILQKIKEYKKMDSENDILNLTMFILKSSFNKMKKADEALYEMLEYEVEKL